MGSPVLITVTLDKPATADTDVAITITGSGTLSGPSSITVPEGQTSASAHYVATLDGVVDVTAILGSVSQSSSVTIYH